MEFVREFVDEWKHLLEGGIQVDPAVSVGTSSKSTTDKPDATKKGGGPDELFENVFAKHNEKLKVIADITGGSKAEVTRSATLVLLYGEYLLGNEEVSAESIKAVCVDQGAYDNKNFAANLKTLKPKIVMDPKPGGSYTVKLTAPGRKFAKEFVEGLNQQA